MYLQKGAYGMQIFPQKPKPESTGEPIQVMKAKLMPPKRVGETRTAKPSMETIKQGGAW